jgi:hypothetical protein
MKRALRLSTVFGTLVLSGGCVGPINSPLTLPNQHTLVRGQLVVHSDFPIASHHRLLDELTAQRADMGRLLALPGSDEPVHVYLFDSGERFAGFMKLHYPQFPFRRAFFLETDTRLAVYAQWGDRVAEDLRHEVAHGYLHSVVPNLPLWLDEGLAEYFEVPRGSHGLNRGHLERCLTRLHHGHWQPDLPGLDRLDPAAEMGRDQYAEAWAWVHFLLHSRPEHGDLLRRYLAELRRDGSTEPLSARMGQIFDRPGDALAAHLRRQAGLAPPAKSL